MLLAILIKWCEVWLCHTQPNAASYLARSLIAICSDVLLSLQIAAVGQVRRRHIASLREASGQGKGDLGGKMMQRLSYNISNGFCVLCVFVFCAALGLVVAPAAAPVLGRSLRRPPDLGTTPSPLGASCASIAEQRAVWSGVAPPTFGRPLQISPSPPHRPDQAIGRQLPRNMALKARKGADRTLLSPAAVHPADALLRSGPDRAGIGQPAFAASGLPAGP
jgi:hypothetical protein